MLSTRTTAIRSLPPNIKVSFFSEEDLEKIFAYIDGKIQSDRQRRNIHIRYKLLLTVLLRTGARISEALMLKPSDFDLATGSIKLVTLKKNIRTDKMKEYAIKNLPKRRLPMHQELKDATMAYFIDMHIDSRSWDLLFPISRITVDKYLTKIEKSTGIKINAHKFRHTFAVRCLLDGVPVNVVQKWLAHSSLIVTSVYADVLSMDTSIFMKQVR